MTTMSGTESGIAEFYAGRSIFMTGATGFMGKVLLEKLLRSCPAITHVYILIRPKRGKDIHTRLHDMLNTKLFELLHQEQPGFTEKVIPVLGDILDPGLGIKEPDRQRLASEVSVVFHSAATVRFDEPLKLAIKMNVLGVRKLLEFAQQMKKLEAMVHLSTAYANCDKEVIVEMVYPPRVAPEKLIEAAEWMEDDMMNALAPFIIKPRPNTYTFTKAMAEHLLVKERGLTPCAIVRPSIVGASWSEPFPGWVDNFSGAPGLIAAIGKGILRTMIGNREGTADIIPVDIATNLIIAAAWNLAVDRPSNVPVYNCTTGQLNRLTWGQIERDIFKSAMKTPVASPIRVPDPWMTMNRTYVTVMMWVDHYLPAWLMDLFLLVRGAKPMMTKLQNRIWRTVHTMEHFTGQQWVFTNQNVMELYQKLSTEDQQMFNFDVTCIDWPRYMEDYCLGVKQFILKDDMEAIGSARKAMQRLLWIRRACHVAVAAILWRLLMTRVAVARRTWLFALHMTRRLLHTLPGCARS